MVHRACAYHTYVLTRARVIVCVRVRTRTHTHVRGHTCRPSSVRAIHSHVFSALDACHSHLYVKLAVICTVHFS